MRKRHTGGCLRRAEATFAAISILVAALWTAGPAWAEHKVALVIGNNVYVHFDADRQLQKAVNDANAVGNALARDGFTVLRGMNLSRAQTVDKLYEMSALLQPGDTALFYYAGHGVALGSGNYLVPSDVPDIEAGQEMRLANQSVAESDVIATLQEKGARITIMILDSCRDNPFKKPGLRSVGMERGFGRTPEANGVFSLYSAGYGQSALDSLSGQDPNPDSVFTRILVPLLERPGLNLDDLAYDVREQVAALAATASDHHAQVPAAYNQIVGGRVYLSGPPVAAVEPAGAGAAAPPADSEHKPVASAAAPAVAAESGAPPDPADRGEARAAPDAAPAPLGTPPAGSPAAQQAMLTVAPRPTVAAGPDDTPLTDPARLGEVRDRLFEQGFDPGEAGSSAMAGAIRAYAQKAGLPDLEATPRLLRSLREAPSLAPWGAITFARGVRKWGMAYGVQSRRAALDQARARCKSDECVSEVSFHTQQCGAFALSGGGWSMTWRASATLARRDAIGLCEKHGPACRIIGAVCADGSDRVPPGPTSQGEP